jgi:uncharacterized protein (DUF1778 family)
MARKRSTAAAVGGNEYRKAKGLRAVTPAYTPEDHQTLKLAAALADAKSLTAFVHAASLEKARKVISEKLPRKS